MNGLSKLLETSLEEDVNEQFKKEKHKNILYPFDFDELRGLSDGNSTKI